MQRDESFKFQIMTSTETYESKEEAGYCLSSKTSEMIKRNPMSFIERTVDIREFLGMTTKGYSFCNIFRADPSKKYVLTSKTGKNSFPTYPYHKRGENKGSLKISFKRDDFFIGSQVVTVDIDETRYTEIQDYIDDLEWKPTCVYPSYSDKKDKGGKVSRRFHLIYVFDRLLNDTEFLEATNCIASKVQEDTKEKLADDCGCRKSQYFNGTFGNSEMYVGGYIYSYLDIIIKNNNKNITDNTTTTYYSETEKMTTLDYDVKLVEDMKNLDYDNFMIRHRREYEYFYRSEGISWTEDNYQEVSDDYFSLYWNVNRIEDGSKRRKKIFERMCLRRIIKPEVSIDSLIFNAYEDIHRFVNNSDGVLDTDYIVSNAQGAMMLTIDEIQERYSENLNYLRGVNKTKIIFKPGINVTKRNETNKDIRYNKIDDMWDSTLSITDNIKEIEEKYGYKKTMVYEYCKSRGISSNNDTEILNNYDTTISINKNLINLKSMGIKVSKGKLVNLLKQSRNGKE